MSTPLVYLQQENVKKPKNLMKMVNINEENLHIFRTTFEGISMAFSGKICLVTILKVTNKQGFTPSLENTVLEILLYSIQSIVQIAGLIILPFGQSAVE